MGVGEVGFCCCWFLFSFFVCSLFLLLVFCMFFLFVVVVVVVFLTFDMSIQLKFYVTNMPLIRNLLNVKITSNIWKEERQMFNH